MKILVVDDELDQLESLRRGLRSKGYSVLVALGVPQALDCLHEAGADIDLVLTDYAMPVMCGLELLEKIRARYGELPVIMMTAYGRKDLVIEALHHRCNGFIEKPFTLDGLVLEIEKAVSNSMESGNDLSRTLPMFVHQLNNPLAAITGSAELAMLSLDRPDAVKKCIGRVVAGTEQIQRISRGLLQASKPLSEKPEQLDLAAVVKESLDIFRTLIALKGITLEEHLSGPAIIQGFRFDLEQIFNNLIMNAIDALEGRKEGLFIRVMLDAGEDVISVAVEDTGCGISEASIGAIFDPYFTCKKNGTGLGLAVVKKAVERHRGEIHVSSEQGLGTRFTVSIPAVRPRLVRPPQHIGKGGEHVIQ